MTDVNEVVSEPVKRDTFNFPSNFVDPATKKGKTWCMEYTKSFHAEARSMPTQASLFRNNANYGRYRRYARGEQSEDSYKELLSSRKNQGKLNDSYRNLDWSIYKIAPKLKNVVVSKVMERELNIKVKAIDAQALSEKRAEKNKLLELVINQDHIAQFERLSRLGLEKPGQPGVPPPTSPDEIDPYMDMHPKNMMALEVKDYLHLNLSMNDWPQKSLEMVGDIFDLGVVAARPYIDSNGMIKLRRGHIERMAVNRCIHPDFSDAIRVGEYYEMTIADLRQKTQGSLGEETYKDLANQVAGKGRSTYNNSTEYYWSDSTYSYAYDHEKVTVFEACWYSWDKEVYKEEKNYYGNSRLRKQNWNYVPFKGDASVNEGKGVADDEYSKMNGGKKTIIRKELKTVYCCTWVVDTNVAFDYGLMTNLMMQSSSIGDAQLPWVIQSTDFMSPVGNIESLLDQFQLNYLQFQSHIASSKPDGIAIEKRSLAQLSQDGGAGIKWDPKESLLMYAEIGSFVFDGYDADGKPLPWLPIKELKNGLSESAFKHLQIMVALLDQIRGLLGINAFTEGQQPAERLGKGVAELSMGATDNALNYMSGCYKKLFERICQQIVMLIPSAMEMGQVEGMTEALGLETNRFWNLNKDIGLRDMGITIEEGPDDALKAFIQNIIQNGIAAGSLPEELAVYIMMEDNPYRQIMMLKKNRLEREASAHQKQLELVQAQGQQQAQLGQQTAAAKADADKQAAGSEERKLLIAATVKQQEEDRAFTRAVILEKIKNQNELTAMEQKLIDDVIRIHAKGQVDVHIAEIGAEAKENAPVASK